METSNFWIDTHCHLDADEFGGQALAVREQARSAGVGLCVIPSVEVRAMGKVRALAHQTGDAYALGIHPLYVGQASENDLAELDSLLSRWHDDPRLVAVGEIGLDYFVPEVCTEPMREKQWKFYTAQLAMALRYKLPVILHVRRSADMLLKGLRTHAVASGIAHAFNGSFQQAQAFVDMGYCLGFGGACTYDRALQLRRLAAEMAAEALVLETDAPDMPPHWLYVTAEARAAGVPPAVNAPGQLPRIAQTIAELRNVAPQELAKRTSANAQRVLPKLAALLNQSGLHSKGEIRS
ncbi:TatD family hydrolase [Hydrogenophaga sp. 5NK40-0174]|uniref:TatD family hydrolase n=1 Tax=Hydrogenophaga sp. 5NK40-0174 TaxID=3127649 RepID=UPI0031082159